VIVFPGYYPMALPQHYHSCNNITAIALQWLE